jgi:hypothetical protein
VDEWDFRFIAQLARIASRDNSFRGFVQHNALFGHEKNAWQLVRHDDDRDT